MIAGVILAGGRAVRMGGGDKALLRLAGQPLLAHVIGRFAPQVAQLAINANGDPTRFQAFGLPVIADTIEGHAGPLAGILAGLHWAAGIAGVTHLATVAVDTPFLPRDLVARLAASPGSADRIVLAASAGKTHPVAGLWPLSVTGALRMFLAAGETRKVTVFTGRMEAGIVDFAAPNGGTRSADPFFNVNTPDDLAGAEQFLGGID